MINTIQNIPNWAEQMEAISTLLGVVIATLGVYFAWRSLRKDLSETKEILSALSKQTSALTELVSSNNDLKNFQRTKDVATNKPDIQMRQTRNFIEGNYRKFVFEVINEGLGNANGIILTPFNISKELKIELCETYREKLSNNKKDSISIFIITDQNKTFDQYSYGRIIVEYNDILNNNYIDEFTINSTKNDFVITKDFEDIKTSSN